MTKLKGLATRKLWMEDHVFLDPASPVLVDRHTQTETVLHRHEFTELVFITRGKGIHAVESSEYSLEPGDFFVMEGTHSHAYRKTDNLELINILIRERVMETLRPMLRRWKGHTVLFPSLHGTPAPFARARTLRPHELGECIQIMEHLEAESERRANGGYDMQVALLQQLLITMCRHASGTPDTEPDVRTRIGKVIRHLEQTYGNRITLAELEQIACMSPRSLQRHFRTATGVTPVRYLLRVRIANAGRMLRETELPLTEIGARCGIEDSAYFSRLFHQFTHMSPSAWRKANHAREELQ